ncbi:23354_t:CDS:2 [Gigaspora margarita]|uniref:23354_t:CDS:1 n=1 Tax=Gigaspora margarita TaxID=4874 RepID=A0ABM8W6R8_GIGMA|nr:23354_t:CDS:2 [Gigaspora margarita]
MNNRDLHPFKRHYTGCNRWSSYTFGSYKSGENNGITDLRETSDYLK